MLRAIADLLMPDGKLQMIHAVTVIGDGDMQRGIKRFAEYFTKIGDERGTFKKVGLGGIGGAAVTAIIFFLVKLIKRKIDKNKKLKAEGIAILKGLEEGMQSEEENV